MGRWGAGPLRAAAARPAAGVGDMAVRALPQARPTPGAACERHQGRRTSGRAGAAGAPSSARECELPHAMDVTRVPLAASSGSPASPSITRHAPGPRPRAWPAPQRQLVAPHRSCQPLQGPNAGCGAPDAAVSWRLLGQMPGYRAPRGALARPMKQPWSCRCTCVGVAGRARIACAEPDQARVGLFQAEGSSRLAGDCA